MGRESSLRRQIGEISSFPKRPIKFYIILSKSIPTRMEADRAGRKHSQQRFKKGI